MACARLSVSTLSLGVNVEYPWISFVDRQLVGPSLLRWLLLKTSMTEALEKHFEKSLRITRLQDNFGKAEVEELVALECAAYQQCYIRETLLSVGEENPCIYAKLVCPVSGGLAFIGKLQQLGDRSLATLLLKGAPLERSRFEFAKFNHDWFLKRELRAVLVGNTQKNYWGRRSFITLGSARFSLMEIFLKNFEAPPPY